MYPAVATAMHGISDDILHGLTETMPAIKCYVGLYMWMRWLHGIQIVSE